MDDYSNHYPTMKDYENHRDPEWFVDYPQVDREYIWTYPIALKEMTGRRIWNLTDDNFTTRDLSIYIHIPYCRADCPFCAFMRIPAKSSLDLSHYADCLSSEIRMYGSHSSASHLKVSSVYFGGGTASLLKRSHIEVVMEAIGNSFLLSDNVETTIECHPDDVDSRYLADLRSIGINRVSFGVQSFQPRFLKAIGRKQDCQHSRNIVKTAVEMGFHSVSIDLMYRLPGQSLLDLESDLENMAGMGIHSMSAYSLEGSATRLETSEKDQPSDEADLEMYDFIRNFLSSKGFLHIAQPDYALPGHEHCYLMNLWRAPQAYNLGIGAGAFSGHFAGHTFCNVHSPDEYCQAVKAGLLPVMLGQTIDRIEALSRYFVLGIRCLVVPLGHFEELYGVAARDVFGQQFDTLSRIGLVGFSDGEMHITREGEYYVDNISKHFYSEVCKGKKQPWGCYLQHLKPKSYFSIKSGQIKKKEE